MAQHRPAGDISEWLAATAATARGGADADVDCDGCVGCCASFQFVHVGPDEVAALDAIPSALLFPAPGLPAGHVLMGHDERGRCPMLTDDGCSIYASRPVTCRTFDCRVFAATGVVPDPAKPLIAEPASRWEFSTDGERGAAEIEALRAAGEFVGRHRDDSLFAAARHSAAGRAVLAIEIHEEFLGDHRLDDEVVVALQDRRP